MDPIGAEEGAWAAGQVDRADDRLVDLSLAEQADRDVEGAGSRGLFAGDREARAADPELAGDPAGDEPAERPHRPVGRQRRTGRIAEACDPVFEGIALQVQAKLFVPAFGAGEH